MIHDLESIQVVFFLLLLNLSFFLLLDLLLEPSVFLFLNQLLFVFFLLLRNSCASSFLGTWSEEGREGGVGLNVRSFLLLDVYVRLLLGLLVQLGA